MSIRDIWEEYSRMVEIRRIFNKGADEIIGLGFWRHFQDFPFRHNNQPAPLSVLPN